MAKGGDIVDSLYLYNGEVVDTNYGFTNNKGIEVCSDRELDEE